LLGVGGYTALCIGSAVGKELDPYQNYKKLHFNVKCLFFTAFSRLQPLIYDDL
jgi:hypothetical protein